MILIDTNVVIALLEPDDDNHNAAMQRLPVMAKSGLILALPIFAELTHFCRHPYLYTRLERFFETFSVRFEQTESLIDFEDIFAWLTKYADHSPDLADAYLVLLTTARPRWKIWTYDREFRTVWRRPDGSAVPLAATSR